MVASETWGAGVSLSGHNMAILLADQNLKFCRHLCGRGHIIEKGRIVHQGSMETIWTDEAVVKRYLAI